MLTHTKVPEPTQRIWKASWRQSLLSRRSRGQYCQKKSASGSWNSMSQGPKQPGLASSGCLTGVHRALAPKPGISPSEKGPSLYHSLFGPPTARHGPFSSRLQESWALPRTASSARPARASPMGPSWWPFKANTSGGLLLPMPTMAHLCGLRGSVATWGELRLRGGVTSLGSGILEASGMTTEHPWAARCRLY